MIVWRFFFFLSSFFLSFSFSSFSLHRIEIVPVLSNYPAHTRLDSCITSILHSFTAILHRRAPSQVLWHTCLRPLLCPSNRRCTLP